MRRVPVPSFVPCRWVWVAAATVAMAAAAPVVRAADPSPSPTPSSTPTAAAPKASTDAVKKELTTLIDAQLAAFRADDYKTAYSFAATEIKGMFPQGDFEKMVRSAYPVIAHSSGAEYGLSFDTGEEAVVNVRISNAEKKTVEYQYLLKKEDGHWKIGGVSEIGSQGLSV